MLIALAAFFLVADEPPPPPELQAAGAAWNECIQDRLDESDRTERPRDVARRIESACEPSMQAMLAAHRRWVEGSDLSARDKADAHRAMQRSVSGMTRMIEMMVRASRDD
jgi:hypothetical protein